MNLNKCDPDDNIKIEVKDFIEKLYDNIILDDVLVKHRSVTTAKELSKDLENGAYDKNTANKILYSATTNYGIVQSTNKMAAIKNYFASKKALVRKLQKFTCESQKSFVNQSRADSDTNKHIIHNIKVNIKAVSDMCYHDDFYGDVPVIFFVGLDHSDIRDLFLSGKNINKSSGIRLHNSLIKLKPKNKDIRIGLQNAYTKQIGAILHVPLENIEANNKTQVIECEMQNAHVKKKLHMNLEVMEDQYNFLGKEFTVWCALEKNTSLSQLYGRFETFSLLSNISAEYICNYFLELQLKFYMLENEVKGHVLTRSLFFYSHNFGLEKQKHNLRMLLDFIKSKICILGEPKKNFCSLIDVYTNISFLLLLDTKEAEKIIDDAYFCTKIDVHDSINQQNGKNTALHGDFAAKPVLQSFLPLVKSPLCTSTQFTSTLIKEYTAELVNTKQHTLYKTLKIVYEELCSLKQNYCLFLVDKHVLCSYLQKLLDNLDNAKFDVIQIINLVNNIQKILKTQVYTPKIHRSLGVLLNLTVTTQIDSFVYALKLIFKELCDEKTNYNEINLLYDGLFVFLQSEPFYCKPFANLENIQTALKTIVQKIIKIHDNNFSKIKNKYKKGFDKKKISMLNLNKNSLDRLIEICRHFKVDIKDVEIDHLIKEKQEIVTIINHYKNKIRQSRKAYDETDQIIKNILTKAKLLNTKLYRIMRYNLHEVVISIIRDNLVIEQICELNGNFMSKREERCDLR